MIAAFAPCLLLLGAGTRAHRPSPPACLNKRVASVISWVRHNIAGTGTFGTAGCSMGAQATFGAVYWNEHDSIIDYQFFMGGPPLCDINSLCSRREHETGHCDADGTTECTNDADCRTADPYARCLFRGPITYSPLLESVVNHIHGGGEQCRPDTVDDATQPYRPFDEAASDTPTATGNSTILSISSWTFTDRTLRPHLGGRGRGLGRRTVHACFQCDRVHPLEALACDIQFLSLRLLAQRRCRRSDHRGNGLAVISSAGSAGGQAVNGHFLRT